MMILAIDLGQSKSVSCEFDTDSGEFRRVRCAGPSGSAFRPRTVRGAHPTRLVPRDYERGPSAG